MARAGREPDPALTDFVAEELSRPVTPEVAAFAADLAKRPGVTAILFYGSCLQRGSLEGMLDFYALTDGSRGAWGESRAIAGAGRALPPNVYPVSQGALKAKVAVVRAKDFRARMLPHRIDTTFWARFSQRAAMPWARDAEAARMATKAVAAAVEAAAIWASRLTPETEGAAAFRALYASTYKVEIRVERKGRAADIVGAEEERFETLWPLTAPARATAGRAMPGAWLLRRILGKFIHLSRLMKAAFTFEGGPRYLVWKIRRHRRR